MAIVSTERPVDSEIVTLDFSNRKAAVLDIPPAVSELPRVEVSPQRRPETRAYPKPRREGSFFLRNLYRRYGAPIIASIRVLPILEVTYPHVVTDGNGMSYSYPTRREAYKFLYEKRAQGVYQSFDVYPKELAPNQDPYVYSVPEGLGRRYIDARKKKIEELVNE